MSQNCDFSMESLNRWGEFQTPEKQEIAKKSDSSVKKLNKRAAEVAIHAKGVAQKLFDDKKEALLQTEVRRKKQKLEQRCELKATAGDARHKFLPSGLRPMDADVKKSKLAEIETDFKVSLASRQSEIKIKFCDDLGTVNTKSLCGRQPEDDECRAYKARRDCK